MELASNAEGRPTANNEVDERAVTEAQLTAKLMAACERGDTDEAVRLVVCCGADVTASTGPLSLTPLHAAARKGHVDTVRALVSRLGAGVNATTSAGMTALHCAAASSAEGATEAVRLLVAELGASVDARDSSWWTPLLMAARRERFETLLLFARMGADVDAIAGRAFRGGRNTSCEDGTSLRGGQRASGRDSFAC